MPFSGLACALLTVSLSAQVGHPPSQSPYRDIPSGSAWTLIVGKLGGNGGSVGIGPRDGMTYGVRFDLRKSGFVTGGLAINYLDLERDIVDADEPPDTRRTGPFDQSIIQAEAVLQFNVTGGKTWHNIAPFFTGAVGYALGSDIDRDTSGFQFGNRFTVAPGLGVRYFLGSNINLRFEARRLFWKLKYPAAYGEEPENDPGGDPVITDGKFSDWTSGWWLLGGFSFSF